jgi:hypothetical protein
VFEIRDGRKTYYGEGDAFLEVTDETPHIVGNDTNQTAVTFHVYKPELEMDTFADDETDMAALRSLVVA